MNYEEFFGRKAEDVAVDLIGRILISELKEEIVGGRIIEVGAYEEGKEISSRKGMKYSPGKIFLMPYRGHYFFNISTDREGFPSCVEIRQIELKNKIVKGSGAVSNVLGITSNLDGIMFGEKLKIFEEPIKKYKIKKLKGASENCLGYFREW